TAALASTLTPTSASALTPSNKTTRPTSASTSDTSPNTSLPLPAPTPIHVRKQTYDPKMRYTTVTYHVDSRLMSRLGHKLPSEGGWEKASALYPYLPDARMDRRTLLVMKREGS